MSDPFENIDNEVYIEKIKNFFYKYKIIIIVAIIVLILSVLVLTVFTNYKNRLSPFRAHFFVCYKNNKYSFQILPYLNNIRNKINKYH